MKKWILFNLILILTLTGCFKKEQPPALGLNQATSDQSISNQDLMKTEKGAEQTQSQTLNKEQREAIYFAASLEKEALRILTKNQNRDDLSLFSVLSYAVEAHSGIKKMAPSRLDCTRFELKADPTNKKEILVSKICEKPPKAVVQIRQGLDSSQMTIQFYIKEWASVVGLSVSVTGADVVCDLQMKNKKLSTLDCLHWSKNLLSSDTSAEEIRLKKFSFHREALNQLDIEGGFYKDLVEHKKVSLHVPLEGKIKLIEKEIEVIDEFADKKYEQQPIQTADKSEPHKGVQFKTPLKKQDLNQLGELIDKNNQKNSQEVYQQESSQENEQGRDQESQQKSGKEGQQENQQDNQQESYQKEINQEGQQEGFEENQPIEKVEPKEPGPSNQTQKNGRSRSSSTNSNQTGGR